VNPFVETKTGVRTFAPALDGMGGMTALFIEITSSETYDYKGNIIARSQWQFATSTA